MSGVKIFVGPADESSQILADANKFKDRIEEAGGVVHCGSWISDAVAFAVEYETSIQALPKEAEGFIPSTN